MTNEAIANAIRNRFKAQVPDIYSLPTQYDNHEFTNPDTGNWCRLTIKTGETFQVSIGSPGSQRDRTHGVMIAQLLGPIGEGDASLREMADAVRLAFRRVTESGVTFRTPSIHEVGRNEDSWQINVVCPFYADDIG